MRRLLILLAAIAAALTIALPASASTTSWYHHHHHKPAVVAAGGHTCSMTDNGATLTTACMLNPGETLAAFNYGGDYTVFSVTPDGPLYTVVLAPMPPVSNIGGNMNFDILS